MRWIPLLVLACLWAAASALSVRVVTAQGPPTRFYGKITVNGTTPPAGTAVTGYVDGMPCGDGDVRDLGSGFGLGYVVDVLPDSFKPGCATDGATVTFKVGGLDARETGEFHSGTFVQVDLTASGQLPTPTAEPTPLPRESPAPGASPAAGGSPGPGASPSTAPSTGESPSPAASAAPGGSPAPEGSPAPDASPSPGASPAASPGESASPTPAGSPGATPVSARAQGGSDGGGVSPAVWALLAVVVLAGAGGGLYAWQRRRGGL